MNTGFRISRITLDKDEEVSEVTAVTSTGTLEVIRGMLGDIPWTVLSETESEITLPVQDMLRLFRECGSLSGLDPRHKHTYRIYDRLTTVVYGLMQDE